MLCLIKIAEKASSEDPSNKSVQKGGKMIDWYDSWTCPWDEVFML